MWAKPSGSQEGLERGLPLAEIKPLPSRGQASALLLGGHRNLPRAGGGGCSGSHSSLVPPLLSAHSIPISQMRQRRLPSPGHALGQQARPGARSPARQARLVPRSLGAWKPEKPDSLCARCPGDARGPACWSQCQPLSCPLAPPPARHGSGHQAGGLWGRLQDSILDQAGKKPWVLRAWTQGLDVDSTCKEGA